MPSFFRMYFKKGVYFKKREESIVSIITLRLVLLRFSTSSNIRYRERFTSSELSALNRAMAQSNADFRVTLIGETRPYIIKMYLEILKFMIHDTFAIISITLSKAKESLFTPESD